MPENSPYSSSFTGDNDAEISGDGSSSPVEGIPEPDPPSHAEHEEGMEELRRLLIGDKLKNETELQERIDQVAHLKEEGQLEEISKALPEAIMLHNGTENTRLANALSPTIEKTLNLSVQRNPQPIVDAIFPIIGPAIRRSIREALKSMMDTVNTVLENSLSPKSIRWRVEALSSGKSFSEVVLAHTLDYRVEQLFLIERHSGLLILQLYADTVEVKDGDVISGMLKAVQDFVRDSFDIKKDAVLESLEIDGLEVLIEPGPKAILAAVIRGIPGQEVKDRMKEIIETIHLQHGPLLESFEEDTTSSEPLIPFLRGGLLTQYKTEKTTRPIGSWIVIGLLTTLLLVWFVLSLINYQRWNQYLDILREEPGIIVTETGWKSGKWIVEGLRDPLAPEPSSLLPVTISQDRVISSWETYMALDSTSVIRRLQRQLDPPSGANLSLVSDTLFVSGRASARWILQARERAPMLMGFSVYDDSGMESMMEQTIAYIESTSIIFTQGSVAIDADQAQALQDISRAIGSLAAELQTGNRVLEIVLSGYVSTEGSEATNRLLSQQRAEAVREALVAYGISRDYITALGTGAPRIPGVERTESDRIANRSVTFSVTVR